MSYSSNRRNGMDFEAAAGTYLESIGFDQRTYSVNVDGAALVHMLDAEPDLSVGCNSKVEGVRVAPDGQLVIVECTGSVKKSEEPGCTKPCTARKMLGAMAGVAVTCRRHGVVPPGYVIVTTALPDRGTSAGGWMRALVDLGTGKDLGGLTVHVLDPVDGTAEVWAEAQLKRRYGLSEAA